MAMKQPEGETDERLIRRLLRFYRRPFVHTSVGLLVLAAIVATLVVIERVTDEGSAPELVDIGEAPTTGPVGDDSAGLGPLDGGPPKVGELAPDFALRGLDGETYRLSDFRGQVVFVNFWATWCGPCRGELPDIQSVYDEKGGQGLVVLAVNVQEAAGRVQAFWDDQGLTMPVLLDSRGEVFEAYRLMGLPDSFFVDREGILRGLQIGAIGREDMLEKLEDAGLP